MTPHSQILDRFQARSSFLLTTHVNPDGDAIGSMFGLAHLLSGWGKIGQILLPAGVPARFSWLDCPWPVIETPDPEDVSCVAVLDCGDLDRVGTQAASQLRDRELVNIDHHTGNPGFGTLNWVDPNLSSTGEMIALLARSRNIPLAGPLGEALYLAIMSDTGSLTFSNTTPQTLHIVSEIIAAGLDMDRFQANVQRQWNLNTAHLHGTALQGVSVAADGRIGIIRATRDMLDTTGAGVEDCDGLVDYVRSLRGVLVAVSLRETDEGVKFSLRTWGEANVQVIAAQLGGGGHPNAAGGVIAAPLPEAERLVVQTIAAHLSAPGISVSGTSAASGRKG